MKTNSLFKITDDIAKKFKDLFETDAFKKEMDSLKETTAPDNGTFKMVISTDDVDRHGEIVSQDGWLTDNYMKNAVVLWGHENYSIPVGITDKLSLETVNGKKQLVAEGRFAGHEFAQTLRQMYDAGMLKASSVGFIPLEFNGNIITKAELLEWSFVSIPANPFALDAAKAVGLDVTMLMSKGFLKEMKEGDETITPDEEKKDEEEKKEPTAEELEKLEADEVNVDEGEKKLTLTFANGFTKTFLLSEKFVAEKAGRVLSKANKEKIIHAKIALEEVIALAEEQSTEEAVEVPADKSADEVKEAEDFLNLRKGVQGIFADLQTLLTDAKASAREKGIKTR